MIDPNAMPQASGGIAGAMPQAGGAMPQGMPQEGPAFEQTGRGLETVTTDLLDALVLAKLKREKEMAKNQLMISMKNDPQTVVAKNEAELQGLTQQEITKGISGVLQNKDINARKNIKRLAQGKGQGQPRRGRPPGTGAPQGAEIRTAGIANNRRPNMMSFAQGGIVGFAAGQTVDAQIAAIKNSTTMSEEQKNAAIKQLYATEAEGQAKGLKGTRNFLNQNLNPAQHIGTGLGGINYLIGGGADLLASGANLANMPKIGAGLASFADKNYASGKKYIDKGMFANTFLEGPDKEVATTATTAATPESNAKILQEEGRMQQGQTGGLPSVVPPPDSTAVASTDGKQTYSDKMSDIYTALGARGLSGYASNKNIIEQSNRNAIAKENEIEIKGRAAELTGQYQQMIVAEKGINNATKILVGIRETLREAIANNPAVIAAQNKLKSAGSNKRKIMAAQELLRTAQAEAEENFQNTTNGKELIARMEALKEAIAKYEKMFPGTSGFGELTVKG